MYILHVQKKSPVLKKCKQVCVSKLLSAKKEKFEQEQGLWKTSITFETCLDFMLYVNYDFNDNKHTFA